MSRPHRVLRKRPPASDTKRRTFGLRGCSAPAGRHDAAVVRAAAQAIRTWAGSGPAWSLPVYLGLGFLLRLPAAGFADGYEFVDQQFQYVDPAWHLATGAAWHRTWEWIDGVRSWVYPGLLAAIFRVVAWIGIDDPAWTMRVVRLLHATSGLLPLWLFWKLVVQWRPLAAPRFALLLFAGSGLLVTTNVQPSGPALAATLAVAAALAVHGPRWYPALGGLCLGLAFCCRVQEAIFGPALVGVLVWQRRFGAAAQFATACVPGIVLQGVVDLAVGGRFLGSVRGYVETNLLLGSAGKWREQPWWFYFVAGVAPTVVLVPPFVRTCWAQLASGARFLPGATAAALLHLTVHSCIARKALRFEHGALAMLLAVVAVGSVSGRGVPVSGVAAWHRRLLLVVHSLLFVYASFWFGNAGAVRTATHLRQSGTNDRDVIVVDGDATSLGGFFYLRPDADRIVGVDRERFERHLTDHPPASGTIVVAVRQPLDPARLPASCPLEPVARFDGMFDLRAGERRFVYVRR